MSKSIELLAKVAATPGQAQVWVTLLQANGIPARVDGDSLVDEFAASRRLMNLMGVNVMVPADCVEQARELLRPAEIDPEELARQAMAEAVTTMTPEIALRSSDLAANWRWTLLVLLPLIVLAALAAIGSRGNG